MRLARAGRDDKIIRHRRQLAHVEDDNVLRLFVVREIAAKLRQFFGIHSCREHLTTDGHGWTRIKFNPPRLLLELNSYEASGMKDDFRHKFSPRESPRPRRRNQILNRQTGLHPRPDFRRRNGEGKTRSASAREPAAGKSPTRSPGRGMATNSASRASSSGSRHSSSLGTWSAPTR